MNGTSPVTLIFIILILKFNNQVKQLITHVGTHCGPNVTSLLWVTHLPIFIVHNQAFSFLFLIFALALIIVCYF